MIRNKLFSSAKSILCLDGNLPNKQFLLDIKLPIFAADGAVKKLLAYGIEPIKTIGDLDSLDQEILDKIDTIYLPDQNSTDFQKSLKYLKKNNLLPCIVCGTNGGFLDHILNNINIIIGNECILYDPPILGITIKTDNERILTLTPNSKISILGFNNAIVSTKGLKWELNDIQLNFPGQNSALNRTIQDKVSIKAKGGEVLILIYLNEIIDMGCKESC